MPKISVIIPTYNRGQYIADAVTSVLTQTCQDFEVIVVDDGSTDDTRKAVSQFDEKVRYVWQPNQGPCKARNIGVEKAMGEYIVFLDSDDEILPSKLEIQSRFLDDHPDVGVVYSNVFFCNNAGHDVQLFSEAQPGRQFTGDVLAEMVQGNFVPIHAAMARRSCIVEAGGFDESLPSQEDWDLWIRIAERHQFAYLNEPVARYRVHHEMTFRDARRIIEGDVAVRRKIESYGFFSRLPRDSRRDFYYSFGRLEAGARDVRLGRRYFLRALALDPRHLKSCVLLTLSLFGRRAYRAVVFLRRAPSTRNKLLRDHW